MDRAVDGLSDGQRQRVWIAMALAQETEVLVPELVRDVFGMQSTVIENPVSNKPLMLPVGRHHVVARDG